MLAYVTIVVLGIAVAAVVIALQEIDELKRRAAVLEEVVGKIDRDLYNPICEGPTLKAIKGWLEDLESRLQRLEESGGS